MYLYLRYFLRLTGAYFHRFKAIIIIGVLLGLALFTFLVFFSPALIQNRSERIGLSGRYHSDSLPLFILSLMSDGLTRVSESGVVEPAIAESWETPDKGKTWIFRIRENIFWQDGTPITSETIQYDFSDMEIEKPDERTIIFKLDQPFSPFPSIVSQPIFKKGLLGMKEWKVKNIIAAGGFIERLELVDDKKNIKLYRFYPTTERTKLAFKLGEVDSIIQMYDPLPFEEWQTSSIISEPNEDQVVTIFFNTLDPVLSEKSIRQALAYAIDKETLLQSRGDRAFSSYAVSSWAYNPQVKPYDFDQKRAKELIDDLPDESKTNLDIKLMTTPLLLSTAERVVNDWRAIGIPATVQVSSVTPTDYQAFLTVYDIPKDPDQYSTWHSTQTTTNISHYVSPRIDKLLEDGRVLIETEERRKVYLDFQRFLLEDLPAVFLYYPKYYTVSRR